MRSTVDNPKTPYTGRYINDRDAQCPFFRAHAKFFILCEGVIPDAEARQNFRVQRDKDVQYAAFCCKRWRNCEHAQAVIRQKYGED